MCFLSKSEMRRSFICSGRKCPAHPPVLAGGSVNLNPSHIPRTRKDLCFWGNSTKVVSKKLMTIKTFPSSRQKRLQKEADIMWSRYTGCVLVRVRGSVLVRWNHPNPEKGHLREFHHCSTHAMEPNLATHTSLCPADVHREECQRLKKLQIVIYHLSVPVWKKAKEL